MNTPRPPADGFTLYDNRPDPLDNRRISRIRFAAANLPVLTGLSALAALTLWLSQPCSGEPCGNIASGLRIGGAISVSVLATYTLLLYQNTLLEKRCNDAGRGNYIAYCLSRANMALAVLNLLLPILPSLLIFGGLLQFALGLALPANPLPNLMGCPKPDTAAQKAAAALSCAAASLMPIVLIIQMRA